MEYKEEQKILTAERLKKLREERGLSHVSLCNELNRRYGSEDEEEKIISVAVLKNYEVTDEFHSKFFTGFGMNIKYLGMFADFYGVSTDYLLGFTDVKSPEVDVQAIHEKIGLSENAIKLLEEAYQDFKVNSFTRAINAILDHSGVMGLIGQFLFYKMWNPYTDKEVDYLDVTYKYPEQKDDGVRSGPIGYTPDWTGVKVDGPALYDVIFPEKIRELRLFEIQEALRDLYKKLNNEEGDPNQDK